MATLAQRIMDLAVSVRAKFNAITPRLLPPGGAAGQALVKSGAADYETAWGPRTVILSHTTDANGGRTMTFPSGFSAIPFCEGAVYQASNTSNYRPIFVQFVDVTTTGCKVRTWRSKTQVVVGISTVEGLELAGNVPFTMRATGM